MLAVNIFLLLVFFICLYFSGSVLNSKRFTRVRACVCFYAMPYSIGIRWWWWWYPYKLHSYTITCVMFVSSLSVCVTFADSLKFNKLSMFLCPSKNSTKQQQQQQQKKTLETISTIARFPFFFHFFVFLLTFGMLLLYDVDNNSWENYLRNANKKKIENEKEKQRLALNLRHFL